MNEHEKMLLSDAIETAIEAHKELIIMKRLNTVLFGCCLLEFVLMLFCIR